MNQDINYWPEEQPIPLEHPQIPPAILQAVLSIYEVGDDLHRVPTNTGVEWWLLDFDGELKEAFWL